MDCEKARELIDRMIDGDVSGPEKTELDAHITGCSACREEFESLSAAVESLSAIDGDRRDDLYFERTFRNLAEGETFEIVPNYRLRKRLFFATAATILIAVTLLVSFSNMAGSAKFASVNYEATSNSGKGPVYLPDNPPPSAHRSAGVGLRLDDAFRDTGVSGTVTRGNFEYTGRESFTHNVSPATLSNMNQQANLDRIIAAPKLKSDIENKIIKTGEIRLEVDSTQNAALEVEKAVQSIPGCFIENEASDTRVTGSATVTYTIRAKPKDFGKLVIEVKKLGKVLSSSTNAQEVTAEYTDLYSRLSTAKKLEERLLKLLEKETGDIEALLKVEEKINRNQLDIENFTGQQRLLDSQIGLSTLNVTLYEKGVEEKKEDEEKEDFWAPLKKSLKHAGEAFVVGIGAILWIIIAVAPWAVVFLPVALVIYVKYVRAPKAG